MDVIILKLCMIVAEGNSGLPFPSREGSEKALKHTMTSKRKTQTNKTIFKNQDMEDICKICV